MMIRIVAMVLLWMLPASALDIVYLKDGNPVRCKVLSITDNAVQVNAIFKSKSGQGSAKRLIPMSKVEYIDFAITAAESRMLAEPKPSHLIGLGKLWSERRLLLGRPRSNAGEVGLAYAELMLAQPEKVKRELALKAFAFIEKGDWDDRRRARAMRGRLRALIGTGQPDRAIAEAAVLADTTDDPGMLIEARYVLAVAAFEKLKKFVEENPRWIEDEEALPVRNVLFNDAIDQFLYAYLFHGSEEDQAARGLWGALRVYEHAEDPGSARQYAEDIGKLYPKTRYAARALTFLKKEKTDDGNNDGKN